MRISCQVLPCIPSASAVLAMLAFTAGPAAAQLPDTLRHSIPAPLSGAQSGERLGSSVAVDGGFTVAGAPWDGTGAYSAGVVKVFDSATGALLFTLLNPSPEEGDQFGSSVAISGTLVVVGAPLDFTGAHHAGSVYVYDLSGNTPAEPIVTMHNPTPALGDQFGNAVAISGTRVAVGAFGDNTGKPNAGSAYVYDLSIESPAVPIATLNNPSPVLDDEFGYSVAISGGWIVVGVPQSDYPGARDAGRVYVYNPDFGAMIALNNPSPALYDYFGLSVGINGSRIVVGAYGDNTAGAMGSVYIYDLNSGDPAVPIVTLNNPGHSEWDLFGLSVAISGTRVVAANRNASAVYVYELSSVTPTVPVTTLNNPGPDTGDHYGDAVAISGSQVAVGAPFNSLRGSGAGSAYIYDLNGGKPTQPVATLPDPTPVPGDSFGTSVAVSGNRMIVGAPFEDTGATDAGSVYVYALNSDPSQSPIFVLNNPAPGELDLFGQSVAISGRYLVVGAPNDDTAMEDAGSTYVYDLDSDPATVPVVILTNPDASPGDHFGMAVAVSGKRVVVGAHYDDSGGADTGSAYVYDLTSATPAMPVATLRNPTPEWFDNFGRSVAISGSHVVVGAYADNTGGNDSGSAYVYDLDSFAPAQAVLTLNNPTPAWYDHFGHAVAISETRVVVSAILDDSGTEDAGSVYVYELTSATPTVPEFIFHNPEVSAIFGTSLAISGSRLVAGNHAGEGEAGSAYVYDLNRRRLTMPVATLHNPGPGVEDYFAHSVAIDGNTITIGTPGDDTVADNKGFAYVFGLSVLTDWRLLYFGTVDNTGHAANDADPNHNGIANLLEFALGGDPVGDNTGLSILPQASLSAADHLQLTFTRVTDRTGITLTVQVSETMADPWTDLAQSTDGGPFQIITPGATVEESGSGTYRTVAVGDSVSMSDPTSRRRYMRMIVTP